MSTQEIVRGAMALPVAQRVALAQALWQSLDADSSRKVRDEEREAVRTARRRDAELSSGSTRGRTHRQVMSSARRALGCA